MNNWKLMTSWLDIVIEARLIFLVYFLLFSCASVSMPVNNICSIVMPTIRTGSVLDHNYERTSLELLSQAVPVTVEDDGSVTFPQKVTRPVTKLRRYGSQVTAICNGNVVYDQHIDASTIERNRFTLLF